MKNEQKYRENYCLVCKNRVSNSGSIMVCGLTNRIPIFENKCNTFDFDKVVFEKKEKNIKDKIKEKYNSDNFYGRNIGMSFYQEYTEINNSKYKTQSKTVGLKIFKMNTGYIMSLTISLFILLTLPIMYENGKSNNMIIFYIFLLLQSIYSIIVLFFKKKEIYIETKEKSLVIKNEREIFWNEILTTGILTVNTKSKSYQVIIGTLTNEIERIIIDDTELNAQDLIKIIHLNVNVAQQQFGEMAV